MKKIILALCLLFPVLSRADDFSLIWDPVTTDVTGQPVVGLLGYKLYVSRTSGVYNSPPKATGTSNTAVISESVVGTYYAVVRAYNEAGESANSNEVSFEVKVKVPTAPSSFRIVP